jgi:hypothetical protein
MLLVDSGRGKAGENHEARTHRVLFDCRRCITSDRNERGVFDTKGGSAKTAVLNAYRPALRNYLMANHYMDTQETISGAEMIRRFGYRECRPK